ncbi:8-amino-7-oxononanoate synthase [Pseudoalteromonas ulvae UL12]|uniref:8-amino-7-oxononanoate synthase n=1 Tax=Pseudoalteromonas ulvae TaxID=107327 RepID=UPI00186BA1E9|nr:8-amino-7-oxononanoate synthase [Pseudoalteromonas ulvae]MBE0363983.1 8-amino-7-oxononanoate synthase [Pseudoalteromonas ulvae UL12]
MAFDYIAEQLCERKSQALFRERFLISNTQDCRMTVDGVSYLNFASNNYLGLSSALPNTSQAGSHSSPLVTGYVQAHADLETYLASELGFEACLLFSSGFSANSSVLKTLMSHAESEIFQDKLNHASLIDGGLAAKAAMTRFNHNDLSHLSRRLLKSKAKHKLIVSEGVFSMDGDTAPIEALSALAKQHDAWLMIDDAHGFGVLGQHGKGSCYLDEGIKPDLLILTFGKAVASSGACVLCSREVRDYLIQFNRDYIYSTAMSPMVAEITLQHIQRLFHADDLRHKLTSNIRYFKQLCNEHNIALMSSSTAIQPVVIGDADTTLTVANELKKRGFWVGAIRPPTVAYNTARLRITLTASHSQADIMSLVNQLKQLL